MAIRPIYRHGRQTMPGVAARLNERYDTNNPDAVLTSTILPRSRILTERCRRLSGYTGAHFGRQQGPDRRLSENTGREKLYTCRRQLLARAGQIYPTPILQVNAALAFLEKNEARLHVDASKLFLAGDLAGAQIAAQLAAVISNSHTPIRWE